MDRYQKKMKAAYKRNMDVIAKEEKAAFGRNSYFRLVERGLYREPTREGDFTTADIMTSSDEESMNSYPYADNPADMTSEDNIEGKCVGENDTADYIYKFDDEDDEDDKDDDGWVVKVTQTESKKCE